MPLEQTFSPLATNQHLVAIEGSFAPQGTGAPVVSYGVGFSVARNDVGDYTLTLTNVWTGNLVDAWVNLRQVAPDGALASARLGVYDSAAKTIKLWLLDVAGDAADVAADADNIVSFKLVFQRVS